MTPMRIDPDENELNHILRYAALDDRRVLDIGCGEGELTCQIADRTAAVFGVDPDLSDLHSALEDRPEDLAHRVHFLSAQAEALPFPDASFDTAIFTSSL